MIKYEDAIESLGEDIARRFMNFEVNDPYETCFGYLCLLEAGSDSLDIQGGHGHLAGGSTQVALECLCD